MCEYLDGIGIAGKNREDQRFTTVSPRSVKTSWEMDFTYLRRLK